VDEVRRPPVPWVIRSLFFVVAAALYLPLLHLVVSSVHSADGWSFQWYIKVLRNDFWMDALGLSLFLGVTSATISTILGGAAALGFRFSPSPAVSSFSLMTFLMPELVFALALLSWFASLTFSLGFLSLLVAHVTFSLSYTFFICRSRLEKLEPWIEEASLDLGATPLQTIWRIHLPILAPTLIASFLIGFLLSFDDFLISYFVSGAGFDTLPMKLFFSMKAGFTPELNALAALMAGISALAVYMVTRILHD